MKVFPMLEYLLLTLTLLPNYVGNTLNLKLYNFITIVPKNLIPQDEAEYNEITKNFSCERWSGMKAAFIFDRASNKTIVFCSEEDYVIGGHCPEWNNGIMQPNYFASCRMYHSTPCPYKINIWESYKYPNCFINDTVTDQNSYCKKTKEDSCAIVNVLLIISFIINFILGCLIFCKRGRYSQCSSSSLLECVRVETEAFNYRRGNENSQKNEETQTENDCNMETEDSQKHRYKVLDDHIEEDDDGHRQSEPLIQEYRDETEFNDQESSAEPLEIDNQSDMETAF